MAVVGCSPRKGFGVAAKVAYVWHSGQVDKAGNPYFYHPLRVARYARAMSGCDYEVMSAALLHDVVEDCGVSIDTLRIVFGDRVADAVALLSRSDSESYADFIDRIARSGNMDAVLVKLCDLKDNLDPNRKLPDSEKARSLRKRYLKAVDVLEGVYLGNGV